MVRGAVACGALIALFLVAQGASASQTLGDLNVSNLELAVNDKGEALLTYERQDGSRRHVLVWGAINALAPSMEKLTCARLTNCIIPMVTERPTAMMNSSTP